VLISLSTTMPQASDLGFLLHKHPDRAQSFHLAVGTAHVLWPEVSAERSTVALLLEVDPVALVRGRGRHGEGSSLQQYVNDRPYAASSMLAVALGKVFRTAMAGRCDARPDLVTTPVPLEVTVPALPSRGGPDLVRRLFEPLGWQVTATPLPLDEQVPSWGGSPYVDLRMSATTTVADALTQLYVLVPVLDDGKHYWVSSDEVDKLLRAGAGWLEGHPDRELVTRRYLKHQPGLVVDAVARLTELDDAPQPEVAASGVDAAEVVDRPAPLAVQRRAAVLQALRDEGAKTVVDLGCGEGFLLRELVPDPTFTSVVGADVSHRALQAAERRLRLDRMPDSQRARLRLLQSSVTYRDDRLVGHDAVVLMEVVEHVDLDRLPALERSVFGHARPTSVVVTTPNVEHNVRYEALAAGTVRHADHRFEWTRAEFRAWADGVAERHGYRVGYRPVGQDDPEVGPPTQMAVFRREA
jgi:3' terminal RNA ribose 2'-O-methyltransferase Hen1